MVEKQNMNLTFLFQFFHNQNYSRELELLHISMNEGKNRLFETTESPRSDFTNSLHVSLKVDRNDHFTNK